MKEKTSAKACSAGTFSRKVPESEVMRPDCLPRMVTDTPGRGFSFSSRTLPDTEAALRGLAEGPLLDPASFFCAPAGRKLRSRRTAKMDLKQFTV